jgi:hypothetical protein
MAFRTGAESHVVSDTGPKASDEAPEACAAEAQNF